MQVQTRPLTDELDLFMCIQCGKCTGGCPLTSINGFNLRALIYQFLLEPEIELEENEILWDCTTCFTCSTRCPKDVHPADVIIALRSLLIEEGKLPRHIGQALTSIFRNNNPFEMPPDDRNAWAKELPPTKNALEEPVDVLYFAGCMPSYEPRLQKVARSLVQVLLRAEVNVGTLGNEEGCCGSEVRRLGEKGLFEMMVEERSELLKSAQAERMMTTSPHCYDVYLHHYPNLGYPVQHYTQVLAQLVIEGRLTFRNEIARKVTYHDPCYLGRQNGVFDEPRIILRSIPGLELVEMDRSRETSLCCEGGGGRMWFDGTNPGVRLANERVQQAVDTGAEILATACPFCLMMLSDATAGLGLSEQIVVKDIVELVQEAL